MVTKGVHYVVCLERCVWRRCEVYWLATLQACYRPVHSLPGRHQALGTETVAARETVTNERRYITVAGFCLRAKIADAEAGLAGCGSAYELDALHKRLGVLS